MSLGSKVQTPGLQILSCVYFSDLVSKHYFLIAPNASAAGT
jgi:hypothetical protein